MVSMNTINAEKSICSSLMFKNADAEALLGVLLPDHFFDETCRSIYELALEAYLTRGPFSDAFVLSKIKNKEQEILDISFMSPVGRDTLVLLADNIISAYNNRSMLVKLEEVKKAVMEGRDYSLEDLKKNTVHAEVNIRGNKDIIKVMQSRIDNPVNDHGTGLEEVDRYLNLEPGNLIVIAARPSMGKTGLVATIIWHLLNNTEGSLFFSLEMPSEAIMMRMLANESGENLGDIRHNKIVDYSEYSKTIDRLSKSSDFVLIDDAMDHVGIYNTAMSLIRKRPNIKNIFIDHLTYIKDPGGYANNHLRIGDITKTLKRLAKELGVKVWLLSQLSRGIESRPNKRPQLSDMRESGSIEEDADVILGIYRESYYTSRETAERELPINEVEILVLKNRDGEVGGAKTMFVGPQVKFTDSGNGHHGAAEVVEYEYVESDIDTGSISMPAID